MKRHNTIYGVLYLLLINFCCQARTPPPLQLAKPYKDGMQVQNYFISEKYDGIRGYWNGKHMLSKQGNLLRIPKWFTKDFPNIALDGEIWIGRGKFEQISSLLMNHDKPKEKWQQVRFMMFDLPNHPGTFEQRVRKMKSIEKEVNSPYLKAIEQFDVQSIVHLMSTLDQVVKNNGEGLMLHHKQARYHVGRTDQIVKLKPYQDAKAIVIAYKQGRGKYLGMLGSLLVETEQGLRFYIGTGFSDEERRQPPPIGSEIIFKYFGLTAYGKPRFSSFERISNFAK